MAAKSRSNRSVSMSETSVSVVRPPSGTAAMITNPLFCRQAIGPLLGRFGSHSQIFVFLKRPLRAAQQLQHHPFARRHALAGNRADEGMIFVLGGELAVLLLAAFRGIQVGKRLHHRQHHVARFTIARIAVVPHAVDMLPRHDRLLRVIENALFAAMIDHLGDQIFHEAGSRATAGP